MKVHAIITAAGSGKRMGSGVNKLFLEIGSVPVLLRAARAYQRCAAVDDITLVARAGDRGEIVSLAKRGGITKVRDVVEGGAERQDSVMNGLLALTDAREDDIVLVHNGANPFVDEKTITDCIEAARAHGAAVAAVPARDTVKRADGDGFVAQTIPRGEIWLAQTPQAIRYGTAMGAFRRASDEGYYATDDVSLVERTGQPVKIVPCPAENVKITLPADIPLGEAILAGARAGIGQDSHRFLPDGSGKPCVLAGVEMRGVPGFEANSDGDVVLHALFNAISQALGERSIGHYADPMCEAGVTDSAEYLREILSIMRARGYALGNVGVMIEGRRPRIAGSEGAMKASLAALCGIEEDRIGITATSGEGLTEFGKGAGVQCFCVVTIARKE